MDHKTAIEKITEIEHGFNVNSIRYQELSIWPIIRLEIWKQLLSESFHEETRTSIFHFSVIKSILKNIRFLLSVLIYFTKDVLSRQKQLDLIHQLKNKDILFFSRVADYSDQINNKFYNRHIDPLLELIKKKYHIAKVELLTKDTRSTLPRYEQTTIINHEPFLFPTPFKKNRKIKHLSDLDKLVHTVTKTIRLNEESIINQTHYLIACYHFFRKILPIVNPIAVFVVCYYDLTTMALIKACKDYGIKTVDVQHGKQGKYHGLYSHWTKIPENGYELLPDYFWCWGQESKNNILTYHPPGCLHHKPVVGGNLWLAKWIGNDRSSEFDQKDHFFWETLNNKKKVILVTLQPLQEMDKIFPAHLLAAMKSAPPEWLWLLRLHPYQRNQKKEIQNYLEKQHIDNIEIDHSTSLPLYSLLKRIDHHVTGWSSVCYEALAFNIPTTIIHPAGLNLYSEYIKEGFFYYADTAGQLNNSIQQGTITVDLNKAKSYIVTDEKTSQQSLDYILNEKNGR